MNQAITQFESSAAFGLYWPTWLAIGGIVVFGLLGLYAGLLFFANKKFLEKTQFLLPETLRGRIMHGIVLAATLPAISLALVLMERMTNEALDRTGNLLLSQTASFAKLADYFLLQSTTALKSAAQEIDVDNPEQASATLRQLKQTSPEMLSLIFVDVDGLVVAATDFGPRNITAVPVTAGETQSSAIADGVEVSGLTRHPADDTTQTASISVPVNSADGRAAGRLIGFLSFDDFGSYKRTQQSRKNIESLLVDAQGNVIFSSEPELSRQGRNLSGQALLAMPYPGDEQLFNFERAGDDSGSTMRYLATANTLGIGWRVYLFRSLDSVQRNMLGDYGVVLAWLGAALIISICLALAMVSGISGPLEMLDRTVREFNLKQPRPSPSPPPGVPLEVRSIFEHLGALDRHVRGAYSKLHKALVQGEKLRGELIYVISNREKEIETRTEELRKANATLERLSREDSLTGLANRRWFAHFLAQTWRMALRENKAISILIMDIDDFKTYNDAYGHQKGDECLKRVAEAINRSVGRASDLVSRYGGEEFVAVLGDTPLEGGLQIAEQIRSAVEELRIPHKAAKYHQYVTLSIGVTSTLPTHDTQPETILIAADRAMYNAKHEGKNRVAYSTTAKTGTYQALVMPADTSKRLS